MPYQPMHSVRWKYISYHLNCVATSYVKNEGCVKPMWTNESHIMLFSLKHFDNRANKCTPSNNFVELNFFTFG